MASVVRKQAVSWIYNAGEGQEYLTPAYYDRLLKPYVFSGSTDLDLFGSFLDRCRLGQDGTVLEIGPGTGRASKLLFKKHLAKSVDFVDLSGRMLSYLRSEVAPEKGTRFYKSDALSFLATTTHTYDGVFSLWSLSHSVHQNIDKKGERAGEAYASYALRRLFGSVLKPGGRFFFIHFDSCSEEQRISLRQRHRIDKWLQPGVPSPSQLIVERILRDSANEGLITFRRQHLKGADIIYSDLNEALETFMNFHMEGVFNRTREFRNVLAELADDLRRHEGADGTIAIKPGCFIFSGERRENT